MIFWKSPCPTKTVDDGDDYDNNDGDDDDDGDDENTTCNLIFPAMIPNTVQKDGRAPCLPFKNCHHPEDYSRRATHTPEFKSFPIL